MVGLIWSIGIVIGLFEDVGNDIRNGLIAL